jgi:hypothetical protein
MYGNASLPLPGSLIQRTLVNARCRALATSHVALISDKQNDRLLMWGVQTACLKGGGSIKIFIRDP